MNAFLFIITGLIVLVGSSVIAIAPIWKEQERQFRLIGVVLPVGGGVMGIVIGLKSAAKSDALMRSTAQIVQTSAKTLRGVDETRSEERRVGKECRSRWET